MSSREYIEQAIAGSYLSVPIKTSIRTGINPHLILKLRKDYLQFRKMIGPDIHTAFKRFKEYDPASKAYYNITFSKFQNIESIYIDPIIISEEDIEDLFYTFIGLYYSSSYPSGLTYEAGGSKHSNWAINSKEINHKFLENQRLIRSGLGTYGNHDWTNGQNYVTTAKGTTYHRYGRITQSSTGSSVGNQHLVCVDGESFELYYAGSPKLVYGACKTTNGHLIAVGSGDAYHDAAYVYIGETNWQRLDQFDRQIFTGDTTTLSKYPRRHYLFNAAGSVGRSVVFAPSGASVNETDADEGNSYIISVSISDATNAIDVSASFDHDEIIAASENEELLFRKVTASVYNNNSSGVERGTQLNKELWIASGDITSFAGVKDTGSQDWDDIYDLMAAGISTLNSYYSSCTPAPTWSVDTTVQFGPTWVEDAYYLGNPGIYHYFLLYEQRRFDMVPSVSPVTCFGDTYPPTCAGIAPCATTAGLYKLYRKADTTTYDNGATVTTEYKGKQLLAIDDDTNVYLRFKTFGDGVEKAIQSGAYVSSARPPTAPATTGISIDDYFSDYFLDTWTVEGAAGPTWTFKPNLLWGYSAIVSNFNTLRNACSSSTDTTNTGQVVTTRNSGYELYIDYGELVESEEPVAYYKIEGDELWELSSRTCKLYGHDGRYEQLLASFRDQHRIDIYTAVDSDVETINTIVGGSIKKELVSAEKTTGLTTTMQTPLIAQTPISFAATPSSTSIPSDSVYYISYPDLPAENSSIYNADKYGLYSLYKEMNDGSKARLEGFITPTGNISSRSALSAAGLEVDATYDDQPIKWIGLI